MTRLALIALVACTSSSPTTPTGPVGSTGPNSADTTPPKAHARLEIAMSRTPCMGRCPVFSVAIHDDNTVTYTGMQNVATKGDQTGVITPAQRDELVALVTKIDPFSYTELGYKRVEPKCVDNGKGGQHCEGGGELMCTDTPNAKFDITLGDKHVTTTDLHCAANPLDELEAGITRLSGAEAWIQGPK